MLGQSIPCLVKNCNENREMNLPSESENERIALDENGKHEMRLLEGVERISDALERLAEQRRHEDRHEGAKTSQCLRASKKGRK